jgi:tetratricopeptide (TPR) repeat protein
MGTLDMIDLGALKVPMMMGQQCADQFPLALFATADCAAQLGGHYLPVAWGARILAKRDDLVAGTFPVEPALLPILEREAAADPGSGRPLYYLGCLLMSLGREAEAAQAWRTALERGEDTAFLHRNLALALGKTGRIDEAAAAFERAIALAPKESQPVLELDDLLRETGQRDRRVDLLEGALPRVSQRKGDVAMRLSEAYLAVERPLDAAAALASDAFADPSQAERLRELHVAARLALGDAHWALGDAAQARAEYEAATRYPPNLLLAPPPPGRRRDGRALWKLAQACDILKDAAAAAAARRAAAAEEYVSDSPLAVYKGLALRALGRAGEADGIFDALLAAAEPLKESDPARHHLLMGLGLFGRESWREAAGHLETALRLDPGNLQAKDFLEEVEGRNR